jgi:hypothetical protein
MNEIFDMDLAQLLDVDSEFIENLRKTLTDTGIDIDNVSLSNILHEYEISKLEFLKTQILKLLDGKGHDVSAIDVDSLSVVIPGSVDISDSNTESEEDQIDTDTIS